MTRGKLVGMPVAVEDTLVGFRVSEGWYKMLVIGGSVVKESVPMGRIETGALEEVVGGVI